MTDTNRPKREVWNYHPPLPIPNSALFAWPPRPREALWWLTRRWVQLTSGTTFLATAFVVWNWLQPSSEAMQTLAPGWVLTIWLSNLIFYNARRFDRLWWRRSRNRSSGRCLRRSLGWCDWVLSFAAFLANRSFGR